MSKLQPILKEVLNKALYENALNEADTEILNILADYQKLIEMFCEMMELDTSPIFPRVTDDSNNEDHITVYSNIQRNIVKQCKKISSTTNSWNSFIELGAIPDSNTRILPRMSGFIDILIKFMLDSCKMSLIGDLPFLPCKNNFESLFNTLMRYYFSGLKTLSLPNVNLVNFENHFDLNNSITNVCDIKDVSDDKVIDYFNNVLALLKPYSIKTSVLMKEILKDSKLLKKSNGYTGLTEQISILANKIRDLVKLSHTPTYPSGIYFELKERKEIDSIFHYYTVPCNYYKNKLATCKHTTPSTSSYGGTSKPLKKHDSLFPPNVFNNLVGLIYREDCKKSQYNSHYCTLLDAISTITGFYDEQ